MIRLWQSGWLSLLLMLAIAGALLATPEEVHLAVRSTLRDCVTPGGQLLARASGWKSDAAGAVQWVGEMLAGNNDSVLASREYVQLTSELEVAHTARRRLEVQSAHMREELESLQSERRQWLTRETHAPLVQTRAVPARVIGFDRGTVRHLADRLIDAGSVHGVVSADFVQQVALTSTVEEREDPILDQGRDAALQPDLPVAAGGVLVGRIRSAGRLTSAVQLLTDPEFRVAARLVRETESGPVFGASGVFAGGGPKGCQLTLVGNSEPVAVGDRVYTQEHIAGEAVSLLIGQVIDAEVRPGEAHWTISVVPTLSEPPRQVEVLKLDLNAERLAESNPLSNAVEVTQ